MKNIEPRLAPDKDIWYFWLGILNFLVGFESFDFCIPLQFRQNHFLTSS